MKNESVHSVSAFGKNIAEATEIIVEFAELIEPGHMLGVGRGIISLSLTSYRISGEMLAHEVYAVDVLPFGDAFKFRGSYVPTATCKRFR